MKITTKLFVSFFAIIGLMIVVFLVSQFSSLATIDESKKINQNVDIAYRSFIAELEVGEFERETVQLIENVLELGYVNTYEMKEGLESIYAQQMSNVNKRLETLGFENDVKENLKNLLNEIDRNVADVFMFKEEELDSQEELFKLKKLATQLNETINKEQTRKEALIKENAELLQNMKDEIARLFEIYDKSTLEEGELEEIKNAIKYAGIEELPIPDYEIIWSKDVLGTKMSELEDILSRSKDLFVTPEKAEEIMEEIKAEMDKTRKHVEQLTKRNYSFFKPTSAALVYVSLEEFTKKLEEYISLYNSGRNAQKELNSLNYSMNTVQVSINQSRELSRDFINNEIASNIKYIDETIIEITRNYIDELKNNFDSVKKSSLSALNNIEKSGQTIMIFIIISILFMFVISLFITASLKKSMKSVHDKMERFKNLDLTVEFSDSNKKDEINVIENSLSGVVVSLKDTVKEVYVASENINSSSGSLSEISNNTEKLSEKLINQVRLTDENVQNTSASIEELSSGIEEVSASAKNVSDISQNLYTRTEKTTSSAKKGKDELSNIVEMIISATTQTKETAKVVNELLVQAKSVGEIVNTISGISEQTNLLALNAAIEAARAGEAGKGFAVVSDEIRKLAEESKNATFNISEMLKKIGAGVNNANNATTKTEEIVAEVNKNAKDALEIFTEIMKELEDVNIHVQNLSETAEEQSASSEEMAEAVDQSAKAMLEASDQVRIMVEIVEKHSESVKEVGEASKNLSEMSDKLETLVEKFKI